MLPVYLLTVCDSFTHVLGWFIGISAIIGFGSILVYMLNDRFHYAGSYEAKVEDNDPFKVFVVKAMKYSIYTFVVSCLLGIFIPSNSQLMRAYVMVEGSKIANAENADLVAAELTKRLDKIIEVLDKK